MKPRTRPAFTLLEVVAALALFVMCAGILLQTLGNARTAVDATWRADSEDADLRLIFQKVLRAPDAASATREGSMSAFDGGRLSWRCELAPTGTTDLHRLTLTVSQEREGKPSELSTHTLFALRPAWSDPVKREARLAELRAARRDAAGGGRP